MWRIRQTPAGWEVLDPNGSIIDRRETYKDAVSVVASAAGGALVAAAASGETPGLLPERWQDVSGIGFAAETGDGRDLTGVKWLTRDPATSVMPLMLQTETEMGHFGAELAGFIDTISTRGGTPRASGRFYDSEMGMTFRDMLLDGRAFGVSMDAGPATTAEFTCTEEDEDGWCIDGVVKFSVYEIIGLTGTPFPAFAEAAIQLDPATVEEPAAVAASAVVEEAERIVFAAAPVAPPAEWFNDPALDGPTPMTVTDDGRVFGHLAAWGTCHISYEDVCVTPPASEAEYAYFRTGEIACADRSRVACGVLTMGIGHASLEVSAAQAVAHYDDTTHGVADLASGEDVHGIWIAGAVRSDLSDAQLRTLRAASPSGDWRRLRGSLELVAALCVNVPGFPVPRVQARTASGVCTALIAAGPTRSLRERIGADLVRGLQKGVGLRFAVVDELMAPQLRAAALDRLKRIDKAGLTR